MVEFLEIVETFPDSHLYDSIRAVFRVELKVGHMEIIYLSVKMTMNSKTFQNYTQSCYTSKDLKICRFMIHPNIHIPVNT